MEESVKNENLEDSGIKQDDVTAMKLFCPYCGNELKPKFIGKYVFCGKCHKRMPFAIIPDEDKSVKLL